ncbi:MAG: hypothetical protein V3V08_13175 [Nannocystaceae bacterium]
MPTVYLNVRVGSVLILKRGVVNLTLLRKKGQQCRFRLQSDEKIDFEVLATDDDGTSQPKMMAGVPA